MLTILDDCLPSPGPCVFAGPIVALLHTEFVQTFVEARQP
jgi:hypothetical protein